VQADGVQPIPWIETDNGDIRKVGIEGSDRTFFDKKELPQTPCALLIKIQRSHFLELHVVVPG
jgi:hypothetical protein